MKILLNSLQRSATKWLFKNLVEYCGTTDIGFPLHYLLTKNSDLMYLNTEPAERKRYTDIFVAEIENKLDQFIAFNVDVVIQVHPMNIQSLIAVEKLRKHFDFYYTLNRKDIVEQTLSILVADEMNIYHSGEEMNHKIKEKIQEPISVSQLTLKNIYQYVVRSNQYFGDQRPSKHLYFEDLIELKNPYEFCDYMKLPRKEFRWTIPNQIEYGNNKEKMIKNYLELREYAKVLTSNQYELIHE